MRKAVWAIVLLLAPLASGMGFEQQDDLELNGHEVLLVLQDGVWTSERWAMVEEAGVQPLRSVRSDALLVWMEANTDPATLGPDILLDGLNPLKCASVLKRPPVRESTVSCWNLDFQMRSLTVSRQTWFNGG